MSPMTEKQSNTQQINLLSQTPTMVDQRKAPIHHIQWNDLHYTHQLQRDFEGL